MKPPFADFLRAGAIAAVCILIALSRPIGIYDDGPVYWFQFPLSAGLLTTAAIGSVVGEYWIRRRYDPRVWAFLGSALLLVGAAALIVLPTDELQLGSNASGFWFALAGIAFLAWSVMDHLASMSGSRWVGFFVPLIFGLMLVYLWQAIVVGFAVPKVLLPAPTEIASALWRGTETLAGDFQQTFLKAVLAGFILGNIVGFATALLADRVPFIQRGLLPLGNFASAVPIVGIAPIMVMWFGFGWESKTAVIVFMIFFPMLVNALAGLNAADRMSLDLMRSYGASYGQTLIKLRLPMALPFLFNALKINSTLALIGAIVSEFFGSPTAGMGFRISVEAARMGLDMVWATIAVAAVAGSAFYGILALLERAFTFWHPSYRAQN